MLFTTASTARPASAFDRLAALATASTSSALFIRILAQNCFRSTLIPRREICVCPRSVLFRKLGRALETAQPYTKADFLVSTERATLSAAELPRSFPLRRRSCLFPESRRLHCASVAESAATPTRKPRRST